MFLEKYNHTSFTAQLKRDDDVSLATIYFLTKIQSDVRGMFSNLATIQFVERETGKIATLKMWKGRDRVQSGDHCFWNYSYFDINGKETKIVVATDVEQSGTPEPTFLVKSLKLYEGTGHLLVLSTDSSSTSGDANNWATGAFGKDIIYNVQSNFSIQQIFLDINIFNIMLFLIHDFSGKNWEGENKTILPEWAKVLTYFTLSIITMAAFYMAEVGAVMAGVGDDFVAGVMGEAASPSVLGAGDVVYDVGVEGIEWPVMLPEGTMQDVAAQTFFSDDMLSGMWRGVQFDSTLEL